MVSFKLRAVNSLIDKKTKADGDENINGDDKNGVQDDISGDQSNGFIQARSGEQSNSQKTKADGDKNINGDDKNGVQDDISGDQSNGFIQARSGEQFNRQKTKGVGDKISAYQTNSFFQLGMSSKKTSIVAVSSDKLKQRLSHKKNSDALRPMDGLNPRSFSTKQTSAKP